MSNVPSWLPAAFPELTAIQPLDHGGQKMVFGATHITEGSVVLKLVHQTQPKEATDRELLAVRQVDSDRVPRIYDNGIVTTAMGDYIWIREQRVHGQSLRARLQMGPLSPLEVQKLGLQILRALSKAETAGIVHRDVKPENIMVDGNGDFWLLDFGIARHLALPNLTATASPFGRFTAGYAPAEQFRNVQADIDSRADLFALGVTIYEAGTGTNPFYEGSGGDLFKIIEQAEKKPMPLLKLSCRAAKELEDLVSCMTQKQRVHRPKSAKEALDWIEEIVCAEGVP